MAYYFADHLGTARVVTDSAGNLLDDADFYPFGGERDAINPTSSNHYKFTGYERDSESGLDYASARHFSSTIGRFMSPDPLSGSPENPQSWNRYSYVYNNPLNLTDSTGMDPCDDDPSACDGWFWDGGGFATGWASMFPLDFSSVDLSTNPLTGEYDPSTGYMQSPGLASQYLFQQQSSNLLGSLSSSIGFLESLGLGGTPSFVTNSIGQALGAAIGSETGSNLGMQALAGTSNFFAGAGDCLTGRCIPFVHHSLTEWGRSLNGADSVVDKNSWSYTGGEITGGVVGTELVAAGGATIAAIANGKNGALFGRGLNSLFNSNRFWKATGLHIRFGWGWEGPAVGGQNVIRLGIGAARGTKWWSHIIFWSRFLGY